MEDKKQIYKVIGASSLGTLIEWYDFYLFGSLAVLIGKNLFPEDSGSSALINTLAIFAAGFVVRPFGALVFGRLGDLTGRKYTFLVTLVLMGLSTFAIGLVPGYQTIGYAAPIAVLLLRLIQGLALGGEYGGAATYVAEHAPAGKRGFFTSWIQTTATLGLFLSIGVILLVKKVVGDSAFSEWGWRIPFLLSVILVGVSVYIRLKMKESPLFEKLKAEGNISINPIKASFTHKANFKMVLLALFGAVMGQGVVWYTGQFYAQSFIENTCKISFEQSRTILLWAIFFATPFFIFFGSLSDRIGRKTIMMAGLALAVFTYRPIYSKLLSVADTKSQTITEKAVTTRSEINSKNTDTLLITQTIVSFGNGTIQQETTQLSQHSIQPTVKTEKILSTSNYFLFVFLVFIQILYVTMVYGPIAAFLVELFPTKIRYTSMSLPYHIGNGVFGGLVPFISTLIVSFTITESNPQGDALAGLWYPISVAAICLVIGLIYLPSQRDENIMD